MIELKVEELNLPKALTFNYEDIKNEISAGLKVYKTAVYTEANIKEAKADRANLNKLKKALNDERKRLEAEWMKPFMDFKGKITEICGMIDEVSTIIDKQVKEYEEGKKAEKRTQIEELFKNKFEASMPWLKLEQIWDERWLNATTRMSAVENAMDDHAEIISRELEILGRLKEYSFEAKESYKKTLNLSTSMQYADDLAMMAAEKLRLQKEREQETAEIEAKPQEIPQITVNPDEYPLQEETAEIQRVWLNFSVHVSMEEAVKLAEFLKALGIEYKQI